MPATVVAFPYRHASAQHRERSPDPAHTQVIRFPGLPALLTERDLEVVSGGAGKKGGTPEFRY